MAKPFHAVEELDEGCVLGWMEATGTTKYWQVRMYWRDNPKGAGYVVRSTRIPFEESRASRNKAKRKANQIWRDFIGDVSVGDSPIKTRKVQDVVHSYAKQIRWWAEQNEKSGKDIYIIKGGRQVKGHSPFWTTAKVDAIDNILTHLEPYWETLPTHDFRKVTQRDLAYFYEWAGANKEWSPSWTHRVITQIRMIWRYGFDEGWADFIPSPFRPPAQTAERKRQPLQEEEWLNMVYWAKDRYNSVDPKNKAAAYNKEAAFQFWAWLNFISWTGIRPPSGRVEKNLIRWEDIVPAPRNRWIIRRKDKTEYAAPILEAAYPFIQMLRDQQKRHDLEDCPWVFAHTRDKSGSHKKGDPIKSFRTQWQTMLKELELWEAWGTAQKDKLVPYALRGFFITMSLRHGVELEKLSRSLGTSSRVVNQTYYDFQTEKEIDELVKRSGLADIGSVTYDENGYPILS